MKRYWIYIVIAFILGAVIVALETPQQFNRTMSFSRYHHIPFGAEALFACLPDIFPDADIVTVRRSLYEELAECAWEEQNYIIIDEFFDPDPSSFDLLCAFVASGGRVFIASEDFMEALEDTLQFSTDLQHADSAGIFFSSEQLQRDTAFPFEIPPISYYFDELHTTTATALGTDASGNINFIRASFGAGAFYLHTLPHVFTNYYTLQNDTREYIAAALSHLPVAATFWDEYYKPLRQIQSNPLSVVMSRPSLRWAFALICCAAAAFMIFGVKRKQRPIPIIEPPRNATLEFVETVGRLYFQTGDHLHIACKKAAYLLEYIRSRFHLPTNNIDAEFIDKVVAISGIERRSVRKLFKAVANLRIATSITPEQLRSLNNQIDEFYSKSKR